MTVIAAAVSKSKFSARKSAKMRALSVTDPTGGMTMSDIEQRVKKIVR
jgi:hypothetical protein